MNHFKRPVRRRLTAFTAIFLQFFVASCSTAPIEERKIFEPPLNPAFTRQVYDQFIMDDVVYLPSKLPLSDFFHRLRKGQFADAFGRVDLNYRGSNASNEALKKVLENGFVPVYVEIRNTGTSPLLVYEGGFSLVDGENRIRALNAKDVPTEFKKFNLQAAAKSTLVGAAAVVGMAALMIAFVPLTMACQGHCDLSGLSLSGRAADGAAAGVAGPPASPNGTSQSDAPFADRFKKKTEIDYSSKLLSNTEIKNGETAKGLVLFHVGDVSELQNFRLDFVRGATRGRGSILDSDRVLRNAMGDVLHMDFEDAKKACPEGSHLPAARELTDFVSAHGGASYRPKDGDFGYNWYWSASQIDSQTAYVFDGLYGKMMEKSLTDVNVAVWCVGN